MHAIAFGSNYRSPFLHTTKSLAVAAKKLHDSRDANAYMVKIDLVGLSGSQRGLHSGSQPGLHSGSQPGAQPDEENPVVVDMSTDQRQKARLDRG